MSYQIPHLANIVLLLDAEINPAKMNVSIFMHVSITTTSKRKGQDRQKEERKGDKKKGLVI